MNTRFSVYFVNLNGGNIQHFNLLDEGCILLVAIDTAVFTDKLALW
jgi:hypothetical protein